MNKNFPARLHVVLAADSPKAVVFRRGPSKEVCTFLWDRKNDNFTLGQWLKGRIYEGRADLSPDGKYLIYFAMNGKWDSETRGSWTAISIAPWLKAIELHAKGDCWEGGGLFLSTDSYWLNDRYFDPAKTLKQSDQVRRDDTYKPERNFVNVYYERLLRNGWRLSSQSTFEKRLPHEWLLRKLTHGAEKHELTNTRGAFRRWRFSSC